MKIFNDVYFTELTKEAQTDRRLRKMQNLHLNYSDPFQKMFNVLHFGTYIRPHRHLTAQKSELLLAVVGGFKVILFDDKGIVSEVITCQPGIRKVASGVEIPFDCWHTVYPVSQFCVIFEGKGGPFVEAEAKDYAPWSPEEYSREAKYYLDKLMKFY